MNRQIILLLATQLLFILNNYAQDDYAIIKDPDGFTNIRRGDLQSRITGKIPEYQPFCCMAFEDPNAELYPGMISVEYCDFVTQKTDNYLRSRSVKTNEGWYDTPSKSGYVHQNGVQKLSELPQLKQISASTTRAVYKNDSINVTFKFGPFEPQKHVMRDLEGKQVEKADNRFATGQLETIDGEKAWGVDGTIPSTEIKSITITFNNKILELPQSSIKNIFEPVTFNQYTRICVGSDGELYIWMQNSDGAAVYHVIWVIVDKKLKYMLTQSGFYV